MYKRQTITSAAITNVTKPTISGAGNNGDTITLTAGGATYMTTVANGAWSVNLNTTAPTSGTLALVNNSPNAISVTATDTYGGVSASVSQSLTIDTIAPATPSVPSSPTLTKLTSRQIVFSAEAGATAKCSLDNAAFATCTSPVDTGVLADGSHNLRVYAVDSANNTSPTGTYTWTIDSTPPAAPAISTNAAYQATKSPTIAFTAEAGTSLQCKMDTNAATSCTSSTTMAYSNLTEGAHTFTITSTDTAGNASSNTYSFTVDTIAPAAPSFSTNAAYSTTASRSIPFTSEAGTTTWCSLDNASFITCTSPLAVGPLSEGSHNVRIRSSDQATNMSSTVTYTWTQDTIAPNAPVITTESVATQSSTMSLSLIHI